MSDTLSSTADIEDDIDENDDENENENAIIVGKEEKNGKGKNDRNKGIKKKNNTIHDEYNDNDDDSDNIHLSSKKILDRSGGCEGSYEETKEENNSLTPTHNTEGHASSSSFSRKRLSILQAREAAGDFDDELDS